MEEKTLVIIEFDYHAEVLANAMKVLISLKEYKILLFTTDKIWKQVCFSLKQKENVDIHTANSPKEIQNLIKSRLTDINKAEAIFFNTIASNFKFFSSVNFIPPVILRIHNSNTYFNPIRSINPKLSPFYIWKDVSYLVLHVILKLDTVYRSKFIREKVDYFQFPCSTIANYALENNYVSNSKLFPTVPYVFMNEVLPGVKTNTATNIVILGGIDKRRRNYKEVYEALKLLVPKLNRSVKLSLVGKPFGFYGKKIIQNFRKLETDHFQVETFNSFVPQNKFDEITANANFLIIPTVKETRYKLYKELYGFTKISGNINDMIVYQKPALLPSFYPLEDALLKHGETYKDKSELVDLLKAWILDEKYNKYRIGEILADYDFDAIVENTRKGLQKVTN
ncbi:hypothetical protein SLH46_02705 [Draconibacterium sp. IB214405]|uniref:hypothetical protein n=1 Tax=Draconibacterium sp. IB214405 TaxID=3097352 RepID=UPI002A0E25D5|nr:hypothetical protein [Draconibacterium sp. IB214405]MDX8338076.1 hypothetical protein [Draconibacterium sp. IB214405]